MKYEAVFGDQKRFNEQNNEMAEVMLWHDCLGPNFVSLKELSRMNLEGAIPHGSVVLAMRRIIKVPTWTKADKEAGKLPPVGGKYLAGSNKREFTCLFHGKGNGAVSVVGFNSDDEVTGYQLQYCCPIETPEEKSRRERNEWAKKASEFSDYPTFP